MVNELPFNSNGIQFVFSTRRVWNPLKGQSAARDNKQLLKSLHNAPAVILSQ